VDQSISHVRIEEIEDTLCQVAEIKAVRVVASPEGHILEVHVLALPTKSPKQLVRDVESTIMARFGISIDHKKISIAQLGQEVMPSNGSKPKDDRAKIISIHAAVSGVHSTVTVHLELGDVECVGEATGPASQTGRQRLVALATLNAIEQYADDTNSFALEDVTVTQLGRERVAVACVAHVSPLGEQTFAGSALVKQSEKDSIVRATLDAINRRLGVLKTT